MVLHSFDIPRVAEAANDTLCAMRAFVQKSLEAAVEGAEKKTEQAPQSKDLPKLFEALRDRLGIKNDYLTKTDVDRAVGDPRFSGKEAIAIVALKRHFDEISKLKDDGKDTGDRVTAADVALAVGTKSIDETMTDAAKVIADVKCRTLYADNCKPLDSISHKPVVQVGIGNCYYYAALASMADSNPRAIVDMIADHKDGTFSVTFPGQKPIKVCGPTDAEHVLFPKPTDKGVWVHVMEKAYGEYCMQDSLYRALRKLRGYDDTPIPQMHTDGGSAFDAGLRVLTNKTIAGSWCFKGPKEIEDALKDATSRGVPITGDTGLKFVSADGEPVKQHVYSVLKYDAKNQILTIRNPWGGGVPKLKGVVDKGDGVFEMPLDQFTAHYTRIAYPK